MAPFSGGMVQLWYGIAYRVLDAQYVGVAQRRRRVFVVGYLGDWRCAAAVLFERHSLSGNPAPRREKKEKPSPSVVAGAPFRNTGNKRVEVDAYIPWPASVAPTINAHFGEKQGLEDQHIRGGQECLYPAQCLTTGTGKRYDPETETLIPTRGGDFDDSQPMGVRRLTPRECERLQGFPDDYTAIPWRGKDSENCPDSHRYKALGNSMAVPVMAWIGRRIQMVENLTQGN